MTMEVREQNEAFVEEDGDIAFHHTKIILRDSRSHYFYALTSQRYSSASTIDPADLELIPIPTSQIWPLFPETYTRAPEPLPQNCYVKRSSLLLYGDTDASTELSTLILDEAKVCEILRVHPHPNIAQYLGCVVDGGRITGLCFVKYGMTLLERVSKGGQDAFDADLCLRGIRNGIQHLHELGLIHCDINPANILMSGDGDDNPIIIDFDSCRREGEHLGLKAGTRGWTREDFTFAIAEIDQYGLSMVEDFLSSTKNTKEG